MVWRLRTGQGLSGVWYRGDTNLNIGKLRKYFVYYIYKGENRVELYPQTGRTHQLRIHCAHPDGLGRPIKGDILYGTPSDRLYLHAESIEFRHPTTGEWMSFTEKEI